MALKTNYVDDILNTDKNTMRKYKMITNDDGTVSFLDVTEYKQTGDSFGSTDVNAQNKEINKIGDTSISKIGDGTITGAISTLNSDIEKLKHIKLFDSKYSNSAWSPTVSIYGENLDKYNVYEGYVYGGQAKIIGWKCYDKNIDRTTINLGGVGCIFNGTEHVMGIYYAQIHVYSDHLYLSFSKVRLVDGSTYDQPLDYLYGII